MLDAETHLKTIPLLRYAVPTSSNPSSTSPYSSGSIYPSELGWTKGAFNQSLDANYVPSAFSSDDSLCPHNVSGGLVGPPWHAVVALENFYISKQTSADVDALRSSFPPLFNLHSYLHTKRLPFALNILHPFESDVPLSNPMWEAALEEAVGVMKDEGWTPSPPVPEEVKSLPEFPDNEDVYHASLYLIECLAHYSYETKLASENCPFGMIDVGFASALAAGDVALKQIALILKDKNVATASSSQEVALNGWVGGATATIESLWNEQHKSYR